jgi:lipid-binding SYLF domain-containing protein
MLVAVLGLMPLAPAAVSTSSADEAARLKEAAIVLDEIMAAPDKAIPGKVLESALGIAVFPSVLKAGFIFGGHRGKGVLSARKADGRVWSEPAFLTLTGGSFGAQIGGQAIDLVLVIMGPRGLESLVSSQFKIGADASVAAGPVGRDAEASTDLAMRAQILSYSRTRGVFAGLTIKGSSVREDRDANKAFYGRDLGTRAIVFERFTGGPDPVGQWRAMLAKHAP